MTDAPNVAKRSPSQLSHDEEVIQYASQNLIHFGRIFLPRDFLYKENTPPLHYEVADSMVSAKPGARVCNILPRGFGKSTLAKAALLYKMYFQPEERDFFCWVSETQDQALDHIGYIRQHIEENELLQYYFGYKGGDAKGKRWTNKDFITSDGDRIIAKGTGQRLRGKAEGSVRYTGIILDDFESPENCKTPERRSDNAGWIAATVYGALEETKGREGWIWLSGTICHFASVLQRTYDGWLKAKESGDKYPWTVNYYRITDDGTLDGKPLWEDRFPSKKIKRIYQQFLAAAQPDKFAQEYFNDARDLSTARIKVDRIKYYSGHYLHQDGIDYIITNEYAIPIFVFSGVDTARTATSRSDWQVIWTEGVDAEGNRYLLDLFRDKIPQHDMPKEILRISEEFHIKYCGIEKIGAEMMLDAVERKSRKQFKGAPGIFRGYSPPTRIDKMDKLENFIAPIVNSGKLHIKKDQHQCVVDELFQYPKPSNDDIGDAWYGAERYSRAPRSAKIPIEEFKKPKIRKDKDFIIDDDGKRVYFGGNKKSGYNWMTGLK